MTQSPVTDCRYEEGRRDGRREAIEKCADHLDAEADAMDEQRHHLITTGTIGGRKVANEGLRKRLARDNRVIADKLRIDADHFRATLALDLARATGAKEMQP